MTDQTAALVAQIQARAGSGPVKLGLILGSGLGHLAQAVKGTAIPYAICPAFRMSGCPVTTPIW